MVVGLLEGEKGRVNIRDLCLSVEAERLPFDPMRDITSLDWQNIVHKLNSLRRLDGDRMNIRFFSLMAADLKLLFPKRSIALLDEEIRSGLLSQLERDNGNFKQSLYELTALKILFPDTFLNISFDQKQWSKYKEEYQEELTRRKGWGYITGLLWDLRDIKLVFPHLIPELGINEVPWSRVKQDFDGHREKIKSGEATWETMDCFINDTGSVKILYPEKFAGLGIEDRDWQTFKHLLNLSRDGKLGWSEFTHYAVLLTAIVSEQIIITKESIEIVMPQHRVSLNKQDNPLPQARKF